MSTGTPPPLIHVVEDTETTLAAIATRIAGILARAVAERGRATMALAGGNTPRRLYAVLAQPPHASAISWSAVHLFLGDERSVPPDHADSNQRMVRESLLAALPRQPTFHPMPAGEQDLAAAADAYAHLLNKEVPGGVRGRPQLDVVLLGVGDDGHTASLFPGTAILQEERIVAEVWVPRLEAWRMSLTLPVINAARHVLFLATGTAKAEVLERIVEHGADPRLPASLVQPANGEVEWYLDAAAASRLEPPNTR